LEKRFKTILNEKVMSIEKKFLYICELKIDCKIIDKMKTDDYEVWYDRITDKVYSLNGFSEIEIKIKVGNPYRKSNL
ncbi:unnamed protein product, partial [marine sediment metagenome]